MNDKFCPECGTKIEDNERFCQNCGAEIPLEEPQNDTSVIGAGARANIMGGINKTTNTNNNINTSNVDNSSTINNSSTVNNSTTYVMNGQKSEYCGVCGNSLEEKHSRCPKCGKEICQDCKVKGKNRCIECEKKAINEYRVAFQQLLLTTNGNIGVAGRQMMNQKARDLDVEDSIKKIEEELTEVYKPSEKAIQPEIAPIATAATTAAKSLNSINAKSSYSEVAPKQSGSRSWIIILAIVVVICVVIFALPKGEDKSATTETKTETVETTTQPAVSAPKVTTTQPSTPVTTSTPAPTSQPKATTQQKVEIKDTNFEAGMKAYNAGEGLDAINYFNKSGSANAYYMLGVIYENGCGNVEKNALLARKNFKKAAKLGSEEAKAKL